MPTNAMSFLQPILTLISDDPTARILQISLLVIGIFSVFLVCFATRDILLRTHSFLYQAFCILLVALLPFLGYLFYLLIRPPRTIKERETERMLKTIIRFTEETELLVETPTAAKAASHAKKPKDDAVDEKE